MTARDHNKLLGIFFLINGGLSIIGAFIIALFYGGIGAILVSNSRKSEDAAIGGIFVVAAIVAVVFVTIFAVFYLFTGWKLYKAQSIGRILGIVGSSLCLLSFPLGTALGVYGLWFLLGEQGKHFYEAGGNNIAKTPPPPNSWQ